MEIRVTTYFCGKKGGVIEHVKIFNKTTNADTSHLNFSCVSS